MTNEVAARLAIIQKLKNSTLPMSQEIHCFHELFQRGSATVVVFPRDLIQSCNAIFFASFKNIIDVCRLYWC